MATLKPVRHASDNAKRGKDQMGRSVPLQQWQEVQELLHEEGTVVVAAQVGVWTEAFGETQGPRYQAISVRKPARLLAKPFWSIESVRSAVVTRQPRRAVCGNFGRSNRSLLGFQDVRTW